MATLEQMRAQAKSSSNAWKQVFRLKDKQTVRVRFLADFEQNIDVRAHGAFNIADHAPCANHFGKDCSYCAEIEDENPRKIKSYDMYAWPVFLYFDNPKPGEPVGMVQVFYFAWNSNSPVPWLGTFYSKNGSTAFMGCDFSITRNGGGTDTTYAVMPEQPSDFTVEGIKVPTKRRLLKWIADARWPELLADEDLEKAEPAPKPVIVKKPLLVVSAEEEEEEEVVATPVRATPSKKPVQELVPPVALELEEEEDVPEIEDDEELDPELLKMVAKQLAAQKALKPKATAKPAKKSA